MKKITFLFLIALLLALSLANANSIDLNQVNEDKAVKNIILMIGDGMGFWHVASASYIEYGVRDGLYMQSDDFLNLSISTNSLTSERTDSASAATAIATGVKVVNGRLSVGEDGKALPTILEYAEELNKSTGLVTTTIYNHATPAAFATHNQDRDEYSDIAKDMLTKDIEVILGGGEITQPTMDFINENNYNFISTLVDLQNANESKLLGVFGMEHLKYDADVTIGSDVRLTDMVTPAINILSKDPDGFFLMIEGGRIDHGSHDRNLTRAIIDTIQFDYGVKLAYDFVQNNPNTLLIVVGDHETGGLVLDGPGDLDQTLPYSTADEITKNEIRIKRIGQIDAYIPTTAHTAVRVPFLSYGQNVDFVDPTCEYNNAQIFGIMKNAYDGKVLTDCPEDIPGYEDPNIDDYYGKFRKREISSTEEKLNYFTGILVLAVITIKRRKLIQSRKILS